mmetsp:Transcript_7535/g.14959  ORF Transcript_7535/g.14959 Transcript_7535/m.14959 type:complete len:441 (+) Transcript_7535:45-1367(+)
MPDKIRVKVIRDFVEDRGGDENFRGLTTAQVCSQRIKPWVKKYAKEGGQSIASLVLKRPGNKPGPYIMHAMAATFLDVLDTLERELGPETFVYFDIFCRNVLEDGEQSGMNYSLNCFESIRSCGNAVMIADMSLDSISPQANPLRRLWCLYEAYGCAISETEFQLFFTSNFMDTIRQDMPHWSNVLRGTKLSIEGASCSPKKVKEVLLEQIENRAAVEDVDKILTYMFKNQAFQQLQRVNVSKLRKYCGCCFSGVPETKEWKADLATQKQTYQSALETKMTVTQLNTDLFEAAVQNAVGEVERLLEKRARLDATEKVAGMTVLNKAAFKGNTAVVALLVKKGAKLDSKDKSGATPMHNAAYKGSLDTVKLLLDLNAEVNPKDSYGRTPLDKAMTNLHDDVVEFLRSHGGEAPMIEAEHDPFKRAFSDAPSESGVGQFDKV